MKKKVNVFFWVLVNVSYKINQLYILIIYFTQKYQKLEKKLFGHTEMERHYNSIPCAR